jgi:hypothetical protein
MLEDRTNFYGFGLIALFGAVAGVALVHIAGRSTTELDFVTTIIWAGIVSVVAALIKTVFMWNEPLEFPPLISVPPDRTRLDDI